MNRWVPLEVFDQVDEPILVSDEMGRVAYTNAAATPILGCAPARAMGRPCWEMARFRTPDGTGLCGATCAPRRGIGAGRPPGPVSVLVRGSGGPIAMRLFTFPIAPPCGDRVPVLHVLRASDETARDETETHPAVSLCGPLRRLSPRELQVLRGLAAGKSTPEIADELFISGVTVRNHIRRILSKLRVHHRIEAVLAWIRAPEAREGH